MRDRSTSGEAQRELILKAWKMRPQSSYELRKMGCYQAPKHLFQDPAFALSRPTFSVAPALQMVTAEARANREHEARVLLKKQATPTAPDRSLDNEEDGTGSFEGIRAGIFTRNHPDNGKPNILMAAIALDSLETQKKRINVVLSALMEMLPKHCDTLELLVQVAYFLNDDKKSFANVRAARCIKDQEAK